MNEDLQILIEENQHLYDLDKIQELVYFILDKMKYNRFQDSTKTDYSYNFEFEFQHIVGKHFKKGLLRVVEILIKEVRSLTSNKEDRKNFERFIFEEITYQLERKE